MKASEIDHTELFRVAACSLDIGEVSQKLGAFVKRVVNYDWMRICLHPQNEEQLQVRFAICDDRQVSDSGTVLPVHNSLQGEAILSGRPMVRKDLLAEGVYPDERLLAMEAGLRSLLVLPLTSRGRAIGTLELGSREVGRFAEDEAELAQEIATYGGIIVEHAWLLEESKELSKIQERRRLAWEIHDTVIQALISIVLQLELAERYLRRDVPSAYCEIKRASEYAQVCLEDARRLVLNLRPPLLEQRSLGEAVAREVAALKAPGIDAQFSVEGSPLALPSEAEMALYRIAQEAVANIRKHARASKVAASLEYRPDMVRLDISDNGVGFDRDLVTTEKGADGHFGLTGAHQRALRAGGALWVKSARGHGTTVTAEFPLAEAQPVGTTASNGDRSTQGPRIRVLLVEDHTLFRQGLHQILEQEPGIEIIGEAADASEATEKVRSLRPDVAIVDVQLPGTSGIEFVASLASQRLATRSLILSAHRGGDLVLQAIKAGAGGYLPKDIAGSALADAIRAVHRGETFLHPAASSDLVTTIGGIDQDGAGESLTAREIEVLGLIALGLRNKEIARKLFLTEATVKYHVAHLLEKLGANSRTEALVKAQKLGVLTPENAD